MESTTTMISNPALRVPPRGAAKRKLLFCIIFIGCCSILTIYSDSNKLNSLSYSISTITTTTSSSTIVQEAMHATPALNVPIQKASSTAEQEGGEDIKKVIQEQEQQTAESAEGKRIGSHNVNKNVINNDGAASNGTTISAAVVEEQAKKYSLLADKNDTNSSIATTSDDTSSSNSSIITVIRPPLEESSRKRNKKFISYELVKDLPLQAVYDIVGEKCHVEGGFMLPEPFQAPGLLDFSTLIDTNLNILYVGDSVAQQFAQVLQEATHPIKRESIRYTTGDVWFENTHIALTPSGGTVAGTRVTGLMTNNTRDRLRWISPRKGGGWLTRDIREMKRLIRYWRPTETTYRINPGRSPCEQGDLLHAAVTATFPSKEEYPCEEQDFDVVVHQFAPGWVTPFHKTISWSVIDEMVNTVSFDYLGANTVVLQTIQIMNNVENITQLIEVNTVIWKYARDFQAKEAQRKSKDGRTRRVIVMDMFAYTVSLFLQNSMAIGLIPNDTGATLQRQLRESTDFDTYLNLTMSLDDVLQIPAPNVTVTKTQNEIISKRGQVCANANCDKKSLISLDGMHWCTKSTGGRINAALACLLRCSFEEETKADTTVEQEMRQCEWQCNKQYMSLVPVPWDDAEEIEVNFTMVDLENKESRIQNNSIALKNYV